MLIFFLLSAVVALAQPANNNFANAIPLGGARVPATGSNVNATKEAGEPNITANSGGKSVWWQWTAPFSGTATIDTVGSSFDTLLGVFTGSAVSNLVNIASNDDIDFAGPSRVTFPAVEGTTYRIAVDGYNGASGSISLLVQLPPTNNAFASRTILPNTAFTVKGSNLGTSTEAGEPVHAGVVTESTVWWEWTAPINATVTIDSNDSAFFTGLGVYTGSALNSLVSVVDNNRRYDVGAITFSAVAGTAYKIAIGSPLPTTGDISFTILMQTPPANDRFASRTSLSGPSATINNATNVASTIEASEPEHAGNIGGRSVWWEWTAPSSGAATISTSGGTFNTLLAVYTGTAIGSLTPVASNSGFSTQVTFNAVAGTSYQIAVDGLDGAFGTFSLGIQLVLPPGNDNFANRSTLSGSATGTNAAATKEAGEPDHAGNAGGKSVWWQWTAPSGGTATISTAGSNFNTLLGVYTGTAVGSLTPVASNSGFSAQVTFSAVSGTVYKIAVDGSGGASGNVALAVQVVTPPNNDNFANRATLSTSATGTNAGATKENGENNHASNAGGKSVWWQWTAPSSGTATISTAGSTFNTLLAVYTGTAVGSLTPVASDDNGGANLTSVVTFSAISGTIYKIAVDGANGVSGNISLAVQVVPTPGNDNFANRGTLSSANPPTTSTNVGGMKEAGEPNHAGNAGGKSVWWEWTAPANGTATVTTAGSTFNTLLAVYTGTTVGGLTPVASNDDYTDTTSRVVFNTVAGTAYKIAVDGAGGATGTISIAVQFATAFNDSFASRVPLNGTKISTTGTNVGATKETGEPNHAAYTGGKSVWWTWTAPSAGMVTVDTGSSAFGSVVAVYTGAAVNSLTPVPQASYGGLRFTSLLTFAATAGTVYQIAVDLAGDNSGSGGGIQLDISLPGNDGFNDAFNLSPYGYNSSLDTWTLTASNVAATKEAGEPNHAGNAGGKSVWWVWQAPYSGMLTADTIGSAFDTLLGVYDYNRSTIASDDNSGGIGTSRLSFTTVGGNWYYFAVDGKNGASGSFNLNVNLAPTNDAFAGRTLLTGAQTGGNGYNGTASKESGEPNHAGRTGGHSLWWTWTAPISGSVSIDTYGSNFDTVLAVYTGTSLGNLTSVTYNDNNGSPDDTTSLVIFSAVQGVTYQIALDGFNADSTGSYVLSLRETTSNDNFANRTALPSSTTVTAEGANSDATRETGEPDYSFYRRGRSIWWSWTAPSAGLVTIKAAGHDFDTVLAVYTGNVLSTLTRIAADEFGNNPNNISSVTFNAVAGTNYKIVVDGYSGDSGGTGAITLTIGYPPVITTNLNPTTGVTIGLPASFPITVTGSNFRYEWRVSRSQNGPWTALVNNSTYSDVDKAKLIVQANSFGLEGNWYCCFIIYGPNNDEMPSTASQLTVFGRLDPFATDGQPENQSTEIGATATFSAYTFASPAASYSWQRAPRGSDPNNENSWSDVSGGSSGNLAISNCTSDMNGDFYRCIAYATKAPQNPPDQYTSAYATLTVTKINTTFGLSPSEFAYNGSVQSPNPTSNRTGATYTLSGDVSATTAGNYSMTVTGVGDYSGANTLSWKITKATATVTLGNLARIYDGAPKPVSVTTIPASLAYTVTYSGGPTVPSAIGSYPVSVTITNSNYQGLATGTLIIGTLPTITLQPKTQLLPPGSPVTLTAAATGSPSPTFQWRKNGANIPGATGPSHIIASAQAADAGSYTFVATNELGSATSSAAVLTVGLPAVPGDIDGDRKADLIWQNRITGERSFWLMNGTALGSGFAFWTVDPAWQIVGTGDFNFDGKNDLVWTNTMTGERSIWMMNGTSFAVGASLGVVPIDWQIAAIGDFNADGESDLVWQNLRTGERSFWLMNGTSFSGVSLGTIPPEWRIVASGDFNADGKSDLVWTNTATGERSVWLMNGTFFGSGVSLGNVPKAWQIVGSADYNGDGKSDLVWTNISTGERTLWLMDGTTHTSTVALGTVTVDWILGCTQAVPAPVQSDFTGDGNSDLIWQNLTTGERSLWLMNGTSFSSGVNLSTIPTDWRIVASGDFNADGKSDIVWSNTTTGERSFWLMNGTSFNYGIGLGTIPTNWQIVASGDYNGDGKSDLVWSNTLTGERSIWLMNGTSYMAGAALNTVPVEWQIVGSGDFNADGKSDLVWTNSTTTERTIWLMDGTSFTSGVSLGNIPLNLQIAGTGDFNGDGKSDIVWTNTATGERTIWLMNGTVHTSTVSVVVIPAQWQIRN